MQTPIQSLLHQAKREMQLINLSQATQRSYLYGIRKYLEFKKYKLAQFDFDLLKTFILKLQTRGISAKSINQILAAVKFYFKRVLRPPRAIPIQNLKTARFLPQILSKPDIYTIIKSKNNYKHKLILCLAYGAGLRVSELSHLKCQDLDFDKNIIRIHNSKANKSRITLLPHKLKSRLKIYIRGRPKSEPLFTNRLGNRLTTRALQLVFQSALHKSRIHKKASFHSLRHSFATHLYESGTDIAKIQKLLGHSDLKTTLIYTQISNKHIASVKSPL